LFFGVSLASAESAPIAVELHYTAIIDGVTAATIDASAEISGDRYVMHALTRTRGVMDMLVGFRSNAESTAVIERDKPVSISHDAENKWRGKDRHVRLRYDKGEITSADVVPSPEQDDRQPVAPELQKSTVDPLTAVLSLMFSANLPGGCAREVPVFDGRRRYEFACSPDEEVAASSSAPNQSVVHRAYLFSIIAGRQKHPFWPQSKTPRTLSVWFGRIDSRLPPIVTKIAARSGLIGYSVRLDKLTIDGKTLAVPSE